MQGLLFLPQPVLDGWLEAGQADVTAEGLHLGADRPLALVPAVRFLGVLEGEDVAGLVGRVKGEAALRAQGAEPFGDSLLWGEVAYQVEPGFLALVPLDGMGTASAEVGVGGAPPAVAGEQRNDERTSALQVETQNQDAAPDAATR